MQAIYTWFSRLNTSNKIAIIGIVVGAVVAIIIYLLSQRNKNKNKNSSNNNNNSNSNSNNNNNDNNDNNNNTNNVNNYSGTGDIIINNIYPQAPPQEKLTLKAIFAELLKSTNKERQEAAKYLAQGNTSKALEVLNGLMHTQELYNLAQDKDLSQTKIEVAAVITFTDPESSYKLLKEAVTLDASNFIAFNQLGHIATRIGKVDEAIAAYEKVLTIANNNNNTQAEGVALGNLGLAYADLGEVEKAIEYYNKAHAIFVQIKSPNADKVKKLIAKINTDKQHQSKPPKLK